MMVPLPETTHWRRSQFGGKTLTPASGVLWPAGCAGGRPDLEPRAGEGGVQPWRACLREAGGAVGRDPCSLC